MNGSRTSLVGTKTQGDWSWHACVVGPNSRYVYFIPSKSRRVAKLHVLDNTLTEIGDDLGDAAGKWDSGTLAHDGCIYCIPSCSKHILKIHTSIDKVEVLVNVKMPKCGTVSGKYKWLSCAVASDGFIYAMPSHARKVLKFDVKRMTASTIGQDLGEGEAKYYGTVVDKNGMICGIPCHSDRIIKMDLAWHNHAAMYTIGKNTNGKAFCAHGGVLGNDGCIYSANDKGQVLKINTDSDNFEWIGAKLNTEGGWGWGDPVMGADDAIYWPPYTAKQVLKFSIESQISSLIGENVGNLGYKYWGGALASNGSIYATPFNATQTLRVDTKKTVNDKSQAAPTFDAGKSIEDWVSRVFSTFSLSEAMPESNCDIFISSRFDGDQTEEIARSLHAAMLRRNMKVYMINPNAGEDFGTKLMTSLFSMKTMVVIGSHHYGAMTTSAYSSYFELKYANEKKKHIVPIKLCKEWPPAPTNPDGSLNQGAIQNDFILRNGMAYIDWSIRKWDPDACAEQIKEAFEKIHKK